MSNKWLVYKITSPNGKVYIGCTGNDLDKRFQNGRGYKFNPELYGDILDLGWLNFSKEIIGEYSEEKKARIREHEEIKNYPDGYNRYRGEKEKRVSNPKDTSKPVVCLDTGDIYMSISKAAKKTGLFKNKISGCCRGLQNKTGGLHWAFLPNDYSDEWRKIELAKKRMIDDEINKAKRLRLSARLN